MGEVPDPAARSFSAPGKADDWLLSSSRLAIHFRSVLTLLRQEKNASNFHRGVTPPVVKADPWRNVFRNDSRKNQDGALAPSGSA
jgi:hypothetical protein